MGWQRPVRFLWLTLTVIQNVTFNPADVDFLNTNTVIFEANFVAHLIKQL